jgi:hypothetical protein
MRASVPPQRDGTAIPNAVRTSRSAYRLMPGFNLAFG